MFCEVFHQTEESECWHAGSRVSLAFTRRVSNKRAIEIYANPRLDLWCYPALQSSVMHPQRSGHFWGIKSCGQGTPGCSAHTRHESWTLIDTLSVMKKTPGIQIRANDPREQNDRLLRRDQVRRRKIVSGNVWEPLFSLWNPCNTSAAAQKPLFSWSPLFCFSKLNFSRASRQQQHVPPLLECRPTDSGRIFPGK